MKSLFMGIKIAYDEQDTRGFIKQNALTLLFTLGGIILVIISLILVIAVPAALGNIGLPSALQSVIRWIRWPVLALLILLSLAVLYRFAPDRDNPQWKWVTRGSTIAAVLWLLGSWAFLFYVSNFGSYNKTYGSVAAVIILLLWFQLTCFIILFGAEINAEMEGQTKKDTTVGPRKPMGKRGAHHADELGDSP